LAVRIFFIVVRAYAIMDKPIDANSRDKRFCGPCLRSRKGSRITLQERAMSAMTTSNR